MTKATAQPQDKYVLRLPDGMRNRIKLAAEASNRSMNAEIVATLEEKYPSPKPLYAYDPDIGLNIGHLHWHEKANVWRTLSNEIWHLLRFQSHFEPGRNGSCYGDNYFVVAVFSDNGELLNLIPHFYRISKNGKVVGDVFDLMTREERLEYNRIYTLQAPSPSEDEFVRRMQRKMSPAARPSLHARNSLRKLLNEVASSSNVDDVMQKCDLDREQ